jgi:site-specific DNA recombinase
MDNKFKVSLYIRVSTGRQAKEGDSLEEQEKELKKYCEYKNYLIHKVHIERGRSAKDTNRPEYQKMLNDVKEKNINAVVVKKLDRLSRSLLDFEEFMRTAQEKEVEFISLKENFDTTNAMGKAMLRVALVFAQLEREQNSERVSDVMTYRAEQGLYNGGNIPYGYDLVNKELVPHKQEKKIVELIFDKFLETKSTALVASELNAMGARSTNGQLWDKRYVDKILRRPAYTGMVVWQGNLYKGFHQPLITESKFDRVQEIFAERKYISPRNKIAGLLKGFLFCGMCGNMMSPNYTKKASGKIYNYYRCISTLNPRTAEMPCRGQYVSLKDMHDMVFSKLLDYAKDKELLLLQQKIKKYNKEIETAIALLKAELERQEIALKTIKQKKEQYLDSLISGDFSKSERERINKKIDDFSLEENQTMSAIYRLQFQLNEKQEQIKTIEPFKQAIVSFKVNYQNMSEKEIQEWLRKNVERIVFQDKEVKIDFKSLNVG